MNVLSLLAVAAASLVALPSLVSGHAALVVPTAFNANPSKTFTCGGVSSGPLNYLGTGGGPYTLQWHLIAGDGVGAINMWVDPSGLSTNFPTTQTNTATGSLVAGTFQQDTGSMITTVGTTYSFTFTLPSSLKCTGSSGGNNAVCSAQVASTSDWVSCFSFTLADVPTSGSTGSAPLAQGSCVTAPALTTCAMIVGVKVWVPQGNDVVSMDTSVQSTISTNLPNPNVFNNYQSTTDTTTPCYQSYLNFLCGSTFIRCNTAGTQPISSVGAQNQPCESSCAAFVCWCDLTDGEADLYRCANYQNANVDSTGACGRTFSNNNSTCVPAVHSSTGPNCFNGLCSSAYTNAPVTPILALGAAAAAAAAARP